MAAMHKQFVVSLSDLRHISIECKHCGSVLTLNMGKLSKHQENQGVFVPAVCSICQEPFDTATETLRRFRDCYEALLKAPERITFRGEVENSEPKSASGREAAAKD